VRCACCAGTSRRRTISASWLAPETHAGWTSRGWWRSWHPGRTWPPRYERYQRPGPAGRPPPRASRPPWSTLRRVGSGRPSCWDWCSTPRDPGLRAMGVRAPSRTPQPRSPRPRMLCLGVRPTLSRCAVRSLSRSRPGATASSSRWARRATTSCGASRPCCAARSRTVTPGPSSSARSACFTRRWKSHDLERQGRGRRHRRRRGKRERRGRRRKRGLYRRHSWNWRRRLKPRLLPHRLRALTRMTSALTRMGSALACTRVGSAQACTRSAPALTRIVSAPGRMTAGRARAISRRPSSGPCGFGIAASARSSPPQACVVARRSSSSFTTSSPTHSAGQPRCRTSPCVVVFTTPTKPRSCSGRGRPWRRHRRVAERRRPGSETVGKLRKRADRRSSPRCA